MIVSEDYPVHEGRLSFSCHPVTKKTCNDSVHKGQLVSNFIFAAFFRVCRPRRLYENNHVYKAAAQKIVINRGSWESGKPLFSRPPAFSLTVTPRRFRIVSVYAQTLNVDSASLHFIISHHFPSFSYQNSLFSMKYEMMKVYAENAKVDYLAYCSFLSRSTRYALVTVSWTIFF